MTRTAIADAFRACPRAAPALRPRGDRSGLAGFSPGATTPLSLVVSTGRWPARYVEPNYVAAFRGSWAAGGDAARDSYGRL